MGITASHPRMMHRMAWEGMEGVVRWTLPSFPQVGSTEPELLVSHGDTTRTALGLESPAGRENEVSFNQKERRAGQKKI